MTVWATLGGRLSWSPLAEGGNRVNTTNDHSVVVRVPEAEDSGQDTAWRAAADRHLQAAYDAILHITEFSIRDRLRMMELGRWLKIPDPGLHRLRGLPPRKT